MQWRLRSNVFVQKTVDMLPLKLITMLEVFVIMHWRLRSQAGAFCKGDTLRAILAMIAGGILVLFVMVHATCMCLCNSSRWLKSL